MAIDPNGFTFWYLGEYSKNITGSTKWATYIGSFQFPSCISVFLGEKVYLPIVAKP